MDRYDAGDRVSVEELISSAESGVEVELTRDGKVVARVVPTPPTEPKPHGSVGNLLADFERLHASLPPDWPRAGWIEALREARDESPI